MFRTFVILMLMAWSPVTAQQERSGEALFKKGVAGYQNKQFQNSRIAFETLLKDHPGSEYRSAAGVMLAKTYLRLGSFVKASKTADDMIRQYPSSRYVLSSYWVKAQSSFRLNDPVSSVRTLALIRNLSADQAERNDADSMILRLARNVMTTDELILSIGTAAGSDRAALSYELSKKYAAQGRIGQARRILSETDQSRATKSLRQSIQALMRQLAPMKEGPVHIGVLTSLTGDDSDMGIPLKEGLELAVRMYNQNHEPKIELHILDNHSDLITSVMKTRELLASDNISLLIGPPASYDMVAVAAEAERSGVPVLSPLSAMNRLTELGSNVYQCNIDLSARFQILADYAMRDRAMKTFAVLAPSDEYGDAAVRSFTQQIKASGGKIIAVERYYEGTQDFKNQLIRIRKLGMIEQHLRSVNYEKISAWSDRTVDSVYALYYPSDLDDKEMYAQPLTAIDGLFLPVYAEDIAYLPPQIAFYNLQAQWLGGDHWNQIQALRQHQSYISGLIFTNDYLFNTDDKAVQTFVSDYRAAFKKNPVRESVFGYGMMAMITSFVSEGAYDRDDFRERLNRGVEWKGIHNRIVFKTGSRINSAVHLMEFKNNTLQKIK